MGRAPCCEKVRLKRGRWTDEEDAKLVNHIKTHGEGSWRSLPNNAGLLRCGKSCRLRWINYLRADLKRGNISQGEEEIIINLHTSLGNRWSQIADHLPGRTDNEIKNYWNSHLSKKVQSLNTVDGDGAPTTVKSNKSAKNENTIKQRKRRRKHSEEGEGKVVSGDLNAHQTTSTVTFSCHASEGIEQGGVLGPDEELDFELLSPSLMVGNGFRDSSDEVEGCGISSPSEEKRFMSLGEERESGVMSSNEENEKEGGAMGVKEGSGKEEVALKKVGSNEEDPMYCDLNGRETILWDGWEGEEWPWLESGNGELEIQGMKDGGYQEDAMTNWLLSDDI